MRRPDVRFPHTIELSIFKRFRRADKARDLTVTVTQHAGDPQGAELKPIGLQLHDQFSITHGRDKRIPEIRL